MTLYDPVLYCDDILTNKTFNIGTFDFLFVSKRLNVSIMFDDNACQEDMKYVWSGHDSFLFNDNRQFNDCFDSACNVILLCHTEAYKAGSAVHV